MTAFEIIRSSTVALAAAAVLAQGALAGGEPKNQPPFTRTVDTRALQGATNAAKRLAIHGEAKNELPFTRMVSR